MPNRRRNPNADRRAYKRIRQAKNAAQIKADELAREADRAASERLARMERTRRNRSAS